VCQKIERASENNPKRQRKQSLIALQIVKRPYNPKSPNTPINALGCVFEDFPPMPSVLSLGL